MRLEQLLLLVDLAQTYSFNQTAERLHTTQQSISYSVKQLESDLGIQIFNRTNQGVEFTLEGKYVLEFARNVEGSYQDLMAKLRKEQRAQNKGDSQVPKRIRFNMASVLLAANMPEVIERFDRLYPYTQLMIKEVGHYDVLPALAEGSCDMAVWSINKEYFEQNVRCYRSDVINYEVIKEDKPVAVVSSASALAKKKELTVEDMRIPKNIFGLLPMDYFGRNTGVHALYENNNAAIHQQMILDSNVICFMGEDTFKKLFKSNRFIAKPFNYPVQPLYHVILRSKNTQHKAYEALSDIIKLSLR